MNKLTNLPFKEKVNELNENLIAFAEPETVFSEKQSWLKNHFLPMMSIDLGEFKTEWSGTIVHLINPIEPYEYYIGGCTPAYHNEFIGENWLAFRLTDDNKYEFLGEEGYFTRSPQYRENLKQILCADFDPNAFENKDILEKRKEEFYQEALKYFDESVQIYQKNKSDFEKREGLYGDEPYDNAYSGLYLDRLGGVIKGGNWVDTSPIPPAFTLKEDKDWNVFIEHQGNPFYHIASCSGYGYSNGADDVILLYEPVSRIALFTFDWT